MSSHLTILHIVADEKFIDIAWREFNAVYPGGNEFLIVGRKRPLRFVRFAPVRFCTSQDLARRLSASGCGAVVFHSLLQPHLIHRIPAGIPAVWIGWGFDYYSRLLSREYPSGLMLSATQALVDRQHRHLRQRVVNTAVHLKRAVAGLTAAAMGRTEQNQLKRFDFFAPVLDIEYRMAIERNPWFRPAYIAWNYGTVEDDLAGLKSDGFRCGDNILVGNCADPLNNHLETFDILEREVEIGDRQVIVPLSYGKRWYRDEIVKAGRQRFGDRFTPLTRFLDLTEYTALLRSCGFFYMNHLRQLAMANICMGMLQGSTIFMNPGSPAFRWFQDKGCIVRSISRPQRGDVGMKAPPPQLREVDRERNRQVIQQHWGRDAQRARTREFVDKVLAETR